MRTAHNDRLILCSLWARQTKQEPIYRSGVANCAPLCISNLGFVNVDSALDRYIYTRGFAKNASLPARLEMR
jgi:hypothetical protein